MTSLKGWHVNLKKQQCRALDPSVRKIAPVSGTALRNADWMGSQQELWLNSSQERSAPFPLSPAKTWIKPLQLTCIPAASVHLASSPGIFCACLFWTNIHLLYRNGNSSVFFQLKKKVILFGAEGRILLDFPSCPLDYHLFENGITSGAVSSKTVCLS